MKTKMCTLCEGRMTLAWLCVLVMGSDGYMHGGVLGKGTVRTKVILQEKSAGVSSELDSFERGQEYLLLNNFLTQRAVQTLIYYKKINRDSVTGGWLDRFLGHEGVERFHGTRALRVSWEEYIIKLLTADMETIVVSLKRRGNGIGGWSKNNPYLKDRFFNYTVDILPRNIGERVLELRKALAQEWLSDLEDIEEVVHSRHFRERRASIINGTREDAKRLYHDALEGYDAAIGLGDSTAYRAGNFDLLLRLSAQQAILLTMKRLSSMHSSPNAQYTLSFLQDFYQPYADQFDGDGPYRVAEDFFYDLADQVPKILSDDSIQPLILDPVALTKDIMSQQSYILDVWRSILHSIPQDNAQVRRKALEISFR